MNITWKESYACSHFPYYDWVSCGLNKLYGFNLKHRILKLEMVSHDYYYSLI